MSASEYVTLWQGTFTNPGSTHIFQGGQVILSYGEDLQLLQRVHVLDLRYPVTVETEVLQFDKGNQALDYFNVVEGQVWGRVEKVQLFLAEHLDSDLAFSLVLSLGVDGQCFPQGCSVFHRKDCIKPSFVHISPLQPSMHMSFHSWRYSMQSPPESDLYLTGKPKIQEKSWGNALKGGYSCDRSDPPCLGSCRLLPATPVPTVRVIPIGPITLEACKGIYSLELFHSLKSPLILSEHLL